MRILTALPLALLPLASAAAAPPGVVPSRCDRYALPRAADAPGTVAPRRLDELPRGHLDLAVMRQMNGCPEPVTIRENFGAVAAPALANPRGTPRLPKVRLRRR